MAVAPWAVGRILVTSRSLCALLIVMLANNKSKQEELAV